MIVKADSRSLPFDDQSFQCIVTSPPYWGQRRYGNDSREIGREPNLEDYFHNIFHVTAELYRVLKSSGILWLNLGDTASGSGGAGGDHNRGNSKEEIPKYKQGESGMKRMEWCNIPNRVAYMMQEEGWYLRSEIIWDKGHRKPESLSHIRRPGIQHEKIFMFTKTTKYNWYEENLAEHGNVWHFPATSLKRRHYAPFPIELPRRCIAVSCVEGDKVFDPFVGGGTTIEAAEQLGCVGYGTELYPPGTELPDGSDPRGKELGCVV